MNVEPLPSVLSTRMSPPIRRARVRLVANPQTDVAVVDYLRLTYPHLFRAENNALSFAAAGGQCLSSMKFTA